MSRSMFDRVKSLASLGEMGPEILVVDEVLAVGDVQFQQKCLGKMQDVGRHGRTILFVSHNMAALQTLCRRAVVLQQGKVVADAPVAEAIAYYLKGLEIDAA